MKKIIILFIITTFICSITHELKACDPSWSITLSNVMDLGGGNHQIDLEVCIGDGGSENGFSTAFDGLNVVSFSPSNQVNGANTAVGSSSANMLDYVYPGDGETGDVFVAQYTNPCFNYTVILDGDPSSTDIFFDGVNCQSVDCPGSCAFVGGGNVTVTTPPPLVDLSCDEIFTDGSSNYSNDSNNRYKICPTDPNDLLTLTFTSFNIENGYDYLYIYDGDNDTERFLGAFTGGTPPGPFNSSSASGCLYAVFKSDDSVSASGWEANVGCKSCGRVPIQFVR